MDQEICAWLSWVLSLKVSHKLQSMCLQGLGSHLKAPLRKGLLQAYTVVGRIQSLQKLKVLVSYWLLAQDHPQLLTRDPPDMVYYFIKVHKLRRQEKESASKTDVTVSCSLIANWHLINFATYIGVCIGLYKYSWYLYSGFFIPTYTFFY